MICAITKDGTGDHHLHTGKPWQNTGGLAWYDNRARWYDPITMRFLAPDPLADKFHDISPWTWCGNTPLRYSDPTGKIIIFAPNSSEQFLKNFNTAYSYLKEHNASELFDIIRSSKIEYHIEEFIGDTYFNADNNTIYWNPTRALFTETIYVLTPSELLNHEFDHAISYNNDPEATLARKNKYIESYGNVEEKRVIEGSEFETAKKLGRLEKNQVTRVNHFGTPYKVPSPDSDEIETVIIFDYVE